MRTFDFDIRTKPRLRALRYPVSDCVCVCVLSDWLNMGPEPRVLPGPGAEGARDLFICLFAEVVSLYGYYLRLTPYFISSPRAVPLE